MSCQAIHKTVYKGTSFALLFQLGIFLSLCKGIQYVNDNIAHINRGKTNVSRSSVWHYTNKWLLFISELQLLHVQNSQEHFLGYYWKQASYDLKIKSEKTKRFVPLSIQGFTFFTLRAVVWITNDELYRWNSLLTVLLNVCYMTMWMSELGNDFTHSHLSVEHTICIN